nr:MAG TPA: hypothetical protein [Caudoviricetes sp.]
MSAEISRCQIYHKSACINRYFCYYIFRKEVLRW